MIYERQRCFHRGRGCEMEAKRQQARVVAFARPGAACCDGRFAAAISMDIKNLVITISHEAE